jgi:hypothetical protein
LKYPAIRLPQGRTRTSDSLKGRRKGKTGSARRPLCSRRTLRFLRGRSCLPGSAGVPGYSHPQPAVGPSSDAAQGIDNLRVVSRAALMAECPSAVTPNGPVVSRPGAPPNGWQGDMSPATSGASTAELQTDGGREARQTSFGSPLVPCGVVSGLYRLRRGGVGKHRAELA